MIRFYITHSSGSIEECSSSEDECSCSACEEANTSDKETEAEKIDPGSTGNKKAQQYLKKYIHNSYRLLIIAVH